MALTVANRPVRSAAGISESSRLVLGFVDGGQQWLQWAINAPAARYGFADESALLAGIQAGLHGSPFALLPTLRLMVNPVKLMTLALADLGILARAEAGDKRAAAGARRVLTAHGLVTQADLAGIQAFLDSLKVGAAPLFQGIDFGDRLALLDLAGEDSKAAPGLRAEAAAFAVEQGRTPLEFVDYYRVYLAAAASAGAKSEKPAERRARAEAALHTLLPLMFAALDCPRLAGGLTAPMEVAQAIDEWLMMGRRLGFPRLSLGVQQVIANGGVTGDTGADAARLVDAYLGGAQTLLKSAAPGRGRLGQDGASASFPVEGPAGTATVLLGPDGLVSLGHFTLKN